MSKKVSAKSKKESHPLDDLTIDGLARNTYELFDRYVASGFSEDRAFELTKIVISSICGFNVKK